MSATDERLELLIGKLLDGEISPAQQCVLDKELAQDGQARELLEQMRVLHECGRQIISQEVRPGGTDSQDIFERAWQQSRSSTRRRIFRIGGLPRFAVGLAAGFLLGLTCHFVFVGGTKPSVVGGTGSVVATEASAETAPQSEVVPVVDREPSNRVTRTVEWYGFTDRAGNRYLVEGLREGRVKSATYYGDL